jgi:hypothetical protein
MDWKTAVAMTLALSLSLAVVRLFSVLDVQDAVTGAVASGVSVMRADGRAGDRAAWSPASR